MLTLSALILAYLMGAIPTAFLIGKKVKGIDLREHGSGNLGATNIFRTLGPWWGVLVLALDMVKGMAAVLVMQLVLGLRDPEAGMPLHLPRDVWRILAGFVAAVGHTLSPFVSFHGGKGVATTAGAYIILAPYPFLTALVVFGIAFAATRIVSLASLCAAAVLPVAVAYFEWKSRSPFSKTIFVFTLLICIWVMVKHRANIKRLQAGTEKPLAVANIDAAKSPVAGSGRLPAGVDDEAAAPQGIGDDMRRHGSEQ
jgi:glycerol-3-phosphate acyltransferase PlsY